MSRGFWKEIRLCLLLHDIINPNEYVPLGFTECNNGFSNLKSDWIPIANQSGWLQNHFQLLPREDNCETTSYRTIKGQITSGAATTL